MNTHISTLVKMISNQGKKHDLLLQSLDPSIKDKVAHLTVKELMHWYVEFSKKGQLPKNFGKVLQNHV